MTIETITFNSSQTSGFNIDDRFFNMTPEQIKEALEIGRSKMVTVCMNLTSDFNKSSIIRANNAFLGKEVIIVGARRFDRRGCVGTHHYETVKHTTEFRDAFDYLKQNGYTIVAVDNVAEFEPVSVYDYDLPEKVAFVYGEESNGLPREVIKMCDVMLYIPQYGSVRSLNVAQAAAVMMSEYSRKFRR